MEYVRFQQSIIPSADIRAAFWLFIAVRIFALYDIVLVPHSTLQNRYFSMTFPAWIIGSQYLISPHGL